MKAVQTINLVYRRQINNHVQLLFEGQFIFLRTVESKKMDINCMTGVSKITTKSVKFRT